MKLVLVGLPTRDAAAAEVFVRKQLRGWDCVSVPAPRGGALPPADLYLIDLAGSALSRWSEEGEAVVRAWLQRAPAVLVVPAFDTSWQVAVSTSPRRPGASRSTAKPEATVNSL